MTVHFSCAARGMIRMIRKRQKPCGGWITGTVLGHTWIVDNLVMWDSKEPPGHEEIAIAVDAWEEELIGVFSAFKQQADESACFAGLMVRIFGRHLEAMEGQGFPRQPFTRIQEDG
ncbi:MAG TPA: hypothetical protein ENN40_04215 [Candidatus Aminicenantes bacterium]|nr:hypothetical protein [Candidatus Aminicenantes bacterium]